MKRSLAVLLALTVLFALPACDGSDPSSAAEAQTEAVTEAVTETLIQEPTETAPEAATEATVETEAEAVEETAEEEPDETTAPLEEAAQILTMSHEEFAAAELGDTVCVETYVQATQTWWNDAVSVYAQSEDGGYFLYNMVCSEEEAARLTPGTKIRVTGMKHEWEGEEEIVDAVFERLEGSFVAEPVDVTDLLGTEELAAHQNELIFCKGVTVESVSYKNDEPGGEVYVSLFKDDVNLEFCVEPRLCGPDSEVYKVVGSLQEGDVIDMTGFLYWYQGPYAHITSVTVHE